MRKTYQLTEEQHKELMTASQPTPAVWDSQGRYLFGTPFENAMRVWKRLGSECGFDPETVEPIPGRTDYFFSAETLP